LRKKIKLLNSKGGDSPLVLLPIRDRTKMKKIILYILLILSIIIGIYSYYKMKVDTIKNEIYKNKSIALKKNIQDRIAKSQGKTATITYLLSLDKNLIKALASNDNSQVNFTSIIKGIESQGGYKNLWIQVIDKNGYSFYRSWTNKVGDNAAMARMDVAKMIQNPKPMQNISTGRFDMTFKTMMPLYYKNSFLGIVELISHFDVISDELKKKGLEPIIVVDEDYTERFIKPFSGIFIGNNYVVNKNASLELMSKIEKKGLEKFLFLKDYMILEDKLVTTYTINNIKNKPMGFFILFKELNKIDMLELKTFTIKLLILLIVVLIFSLLIILLMINRTYVKDLNLEVRKKTKKVRKQKDKLKSLLKVYDKNVIFSKTDLKGNITHVSEAFCKISGYAREELLGRNHNIIRHPDMEKESFEYLWKELKNKRSVTLEVKNLKKDGGYYWVEAEFELEYDKKGKHIGYSAVRDDITSNKDIEEIQKEIIFTMGSIGESRSKETGNHVKRVAEYSKLLALHSGLSIEDAEMLKQASPMHDIGKVAIPDSILNKAGKLDAEEFLEMKTHAIKGYEMLNISDRPILKVAATIALEHHEKWDGTGYPNKLKGDNINIFGRITAVADVFDALGSDRVYKKAWNDEKIFEFFKNEKGKHFDPELIDIFFENLEQFLLIRSKFQDIE